MLPVSRVTKKKGTSAITSRSYFHGKDLACFKFIGFRSRKPHVAHDRLMKSRRWLAIRAFTIWASTAYLSLMSLPRNRIDAGANLSFIPCFLRCWITAMLRINADPSHRISGNLPRAAVPDNGPTDEPGITAAAVESQAHNRLLSSRKSCHETTGLSPSSLQGKSLIQGGLIVGNENQGAPHSSPQSRHLTSGRK